MKFSSIIITTLLLIVLFSCNEDTYNDSNYPTKIELLSEVEQIKVAEQISESGLYGCTYVNQYGVPYIDSIEVYIEDYALWKFDTNEAELKQLLKEAIEDYGPFVNVSDSALVSVKNITTIDGMTYASFKENHPDSIPPFWLITTNTQTYQGMEVKGTSLVFLFSENGLVGISGQWYNPIYIPETDFYTEDKAKESLLNKSYGSNTNAMVIGTDTYWYTSNKVIIPIIQNEAIELRICWLLHPEEWEIAIDTQSGQEWYNINFDNL